MPKTENDKNSDRSLQGWVDIILQKRCRVCGKPIFKGAVPYKKDNRGYRHDYCDE